MLRFAIGLAALAALPSVVRAEPGAPPMIEIIPVRLSGDGENLRVTPLPLKNGGAPLGIDPGYVEASKPRIGAIGTWALHYDSATAASASLGLLIGDATCEGDGHLMFCSGKGGLIRLSLGQAGARASIGFAGIEALGTGSRRLGLVTVPITGLSISGSVIRTFEARDVDTHESFLPAGQSTYLGGQLDLTAIVRLSVGLFTMVHSDGLTDEEDNWFLNTGIGVGF